MYIVVVVALAVGILAFGFVFGLSAGESWLSRKIAKRRETELQELKAKIRRSLDNNGYKTLGGLESSIDPETELLKVWGDHSSRTFPVGKSPSGSWGVYVYNRDGERLLMTKDAFELYLLEIRDEDKNRERQAGFTSASESAAANK
jgi:hypothetical protein